MVMKRFRKNPEPAKEPIPAPSAEESEATQTPEHTEPDSPISTLPDNSEPLESDTNSSLPVAETDTEETETGTLYEDPPFFTSVSSGMWITSGVALLFLATAVAMTILWLKAKRKAKEAPVPATLHLQVSKLHEQGARDSQQDCFFVSPEQYYETYGILAVVADGMGGMADGDRFSETAVRAMMNQFLVTPGSADLVLKALLLEANKSVNQLIADESVGRGGSTLVAGLLKNGSFHYLSVGDSRIALFRNGILYQLNREHIFRNDLTISAVNGEISLEEAENHPRGAGLVSYLGMGQIKYADIPAEPIKALPGDRFLLMSDGVYNALTKAELIKLLSAPGNAADNLRNAISGKAYRNQDNYTAVIIDC